MAYSSTNPPHMVWEMLGGKMRGWGYVSSDAVATVCGSSYFSDGYSRGMRAGHIVYVLNTASTLGSIGYISNATSGAGATMLSSFVTT